MEIRFEIFYDLVTRCFDGGESEYHDLCAWIYQHMVYTLLMIHPRGDLVGIIRADSLFNIDPGHRPAVRVRCRRAVHPPDVERQYPHEEQKAREAVQRDLFNGFGFHSIDF